MIGLASFPERTLVDHAMTLMVAGPIGADRLAQEVLGLSNAPLAVAERLAVALFAADPRVTQLEDGRWALVAEAQGSPLLEECAFAVVDVETTGMRAGRPRPDHRRGGGGGAGGPAGDRLRVAGQPRRPDPVPDPVAHRNHRSDGPGGADL